MDNNFSQTQIDNIIEMYKSGLSIDTIIAKFDTEERSIRMILKEYKVDRNYNMWSDELYS